MSTQRDFDVVLFGATSVTARRIAAYLSHHSTRWAAAGRDHGRIDDCLARSGVLAPATIVADATDPASLKQMAARAKVVLNLVGPYTRYGEPVIAACVDAGAHYVDLTGEIPFVARMISTYGRRAADAGVKVVQVCGFEALPPDLLMHRAAELAEGPLTEVDVGFVLTGRPRGLPRPSDFLSGGTLQSVADASTDPDARSLADPAVLIEDRDRAATVRRISPIRLRPRREGNDVVAPMFPAAFINPPVLHRSAELAGLAPFRFREGSVLSGSAMTLPARAAAAGVMAGIQVPLLAIGRSPDGVRGRARAVMRRVFPDAGFGPSDDRVEDWRWSMTVTGRTAAGETVAVGFDADGHPGYLTTSTIMAETALALAEDGATPDRAGHLTPANALGTGTIARFERAGMRFAVRS